MKKIGLVILALLVVIPFSFGIFFRQELVGAWAALRPSKQNIATLINSNTTSLPLHLPPGFQIDIVAKNLPGARVIAFHSSGDIFVSAPSESKIWRLVKRGSIFEPEQLPVNNLRYPHGLAFDPENPDTLYIAKEDGISSVNIHNPGRQSTITPLPRGGRHRTRTLGFGPDGRLYVSIGSTCDVCVEKDPRYAAVYSLDKSGNDFKLFASGLRNAVFFTWHAESKKMWATEMGRDFLGDTIPPDEINIVEEGKNYGWPKCYGMNIHDTTWDARKYENPPCQEPQFYPSHIDLPAHVAPLGLAFIPPSWGLEYGGDLLVALHGSWNSTKPVGYSIIRVKLGKEGGYEGMEDFISGWVTKNDTLGRPVDLVFDKDGNLYISDDKAGVIYRLKYAYSSKK